MSYSRHVHIILTAVFFSALFCSPDLHAGVISSAGSVQSEIKAEIEEEKEEFRSAGLFKPLSLESMTWHAKKGFMPSDAGGFDSTRSGVKEITSFPVHLNALFSTPPSVLPNHFTMQLNFSLSPSDLRNKTEPAFYFPVIGENWEVFLNGQSLRKEIYLGENGTIDTRRTLYRVIIPFSHDLLRESGNTLVIHFIGDAPVSFFYQNNDLGFHYSADYRIMPLN
ncbi:MAG: hypothetical protein ACRCUT_15170, partial [Spirochaetota bacterium]